MARARHRLQVATFAPIAVVGATGAVEDVSLVLGRLAPEPLPPRAARRGGDLVVVLKALGVMDSDFLDEAGTQDRLFALGYRDRKVVDLHPGHREVAPRELVTQMCTYLLERLAE